MFFKTQVDKVHVPEKYEDVDFCGIPVIYEIESSFMPNDSPTLSIKDFSMSMTMSVTLTNVKTVCFSFSQIISSTFTLIYNPEKETKLYTLTEIDTYKKMPYIIYSLSPKYVPSYLQVTLDTNKKRISPEKLIGIVCGSVGVFFIILSIIIFAIRRKHENKSLLDEDLYSSDNENGNEKVIFFEGYDPKTSIKKDIKIDNWI